MIAEGIGAFSLAIWIYLVFARGGFWRMEIQDLSSLTPAIPSRRVAVVVPARNEAALIAQSVKSLLLQDYGGSMQVLVVDDHSSDGTAERAHEAAEQAGFPDRLRVVPAGPLPEGWAGKVWALSEGVRAATEFAPDYYWFTDADIVHEPGNLGHLLAQAETGGFGLVSLMVKLRCESFAERMLIPAFVFFFFMLYPPAWVASSEKRTAAAAGGCILIKAAALAKIGGIAAIRSELIDDCALARAVKGKGERIWLGLTQEARSVREYESFGQIGRMIARSAFTQLHHSVALLSAVVLGMLITYLVPLAMIGTGKMAAVSGFAAWALMTIAYWPTLKLYRISGLWAPMLPAIALFYIATTIYSAVQYWRGFGGIWKGRPQAVVRG